MNEVHVTNIRTAPYEDLNTPGLGSHRVLLQKGEVGTSDTLNIVYWTLVGKSHGAYHLHEQHDNVMLCLKGKLDMIVGGLHYVLEEGDMIYIPRMIPHSSANAGDTPTEGLEMYAPGRSKSDKSVKVPLPAQIQEAPKKR